MNSKFTHDFVINSIKIQRALKTYTSTKTEEIAMPCAEFIGSDAINIEAIKSLFNVKGDSLLIAPTGKGKTNVMFKVFKTFDDSINIMFTPNTVQNVQNEANCLDCKVNAIVGGVHVDSFDFNVDNIFSCVYDMACVLDCLFATGKKINVVIDEAHQLVEAYGYRKDAIKSLTDFTSKVKESGGSVVYMTATPDPLMYKHFDHILSFEPTNYAAPANKVCIYKFKKISVDKIAKQIMELIDSGKIPIVMLQSIDDTKLICDIMMDHGYTTLKMDGSDKKYKLVPNPESDYDDMIKQYNNKMYHDVVEHSQLPDTDENGNKIMAYFSTSLIEVGTNIKGVNGYANPNLMPIVIVSDINKMRYTGIIQFFARLRFPVDSYGVFMPEIVLKENNKGMAPVRSFCYNRYKKINEAMARYDSMVNFIYELFPIEDAPYQVDAMLLAQTALGDKSNLGCIYFDSENREIGYNNDTLWLQCYTDYQTQYFYCQDIFARDLSAVLGIPVDEVYVKESDDIPTSPEQKQHIMDIINKIPNNFEMISALRNNKRIDELTDIYGSTEYEQLTNLIQLDISISDAQNIISNSNDVKGIIKQVKKDHEKAALKTFSNDLVTLKAIVKEELDLPFNHPKKQKINILKDTQYWDCLKRAIKEDLDFKGLVSYILSNKCKSYNDAKHYLYEEQMRKKNTIYIALENEGLDYFATSWGAAGKEHHILLEALYNQNSKGNFYQKKITNEVLEQIAETLNKEMVKYTLRFKKYNKPLVRRMIKSCFTVKNVDKSFYVTGLKTKNEAVTQSTIQKMA